MTKRTQIGVWVSAAYVIAVLVYLIGVGASRGKLFGLEPNSLGDLLAGVAGPLAFLWLVLGYLQQGEELRLQREQLELQRQELKMQREETARLANEATIQAKALRKAEKHSRRATYLQLHELMTNTLRVIAMRLAASLFDELAMRRCSEAHARGVVDIFSTDLAAMLENQTAHKFTYSRDLYKKNPAFKKSVDQYLMFFEGLVTQTRLRKMSSLFFALNRDSALADLYRCLCKVSDREAIDMEKPAAESPARNLS